MIRELLTFVQVGAGTAGVEMAGTIAELLRMTLAKDFRYIEARSARILLLEAGPRISSTYPETLSKRALDHLRRLGVDVRVDESHRDGRERSWAFGVTNVGNPRLSRPRSPLSTLEVLCEQSTF